MTLPESGKIVVAAPNFAVRLVEHDPIFGVRVFTLPGLPDDKVYVINLDLLTPDLLKAGPETIGVGGSARTSNATAPDVGPETCQHPSTSFDRSFCGCGSMHDYCETCGKAIGCPLDDPGPKESE